MRIAEAKTLPDWRGRVFKYAEEDGVGCWLWTGATTRRGYGLFNGPEGHPIRKMTVAHRWAYYAVGLEIPEGLELDHLCNVRGCVNPKHLEPVTAEENRRRAVERRTHCKWGHEFNEANTHLRRDGGRKCRRCHANYMRTGRRWDEVPA